MREQFEALGEELKSGLTMVADLILLNLLFLLCSIPVITVGAAQVACLSGMNRMIRGDRSGISVAGYFRDFAASFKKATLAWAIELACLAILAGDYWFAVVYSQPANTFFLIFAIVLAAVVLLAAVWVYPLIARYENSVGAHIKNSLLMGLAHFPKTLLALIVQMIFLLVPFIIFDLFTFFGWFWLLVGASLPLYLTAKLFGPALQNQQVKEDADQPSKE